MSLPTPLKKTGGYWRSSWYDEDGERRWVSFGNVKKVKRTEAQAQYESWLQDWHTDEIVRNPARKKTTVATLAQRYQKHADSYYRRPDGTPTREAVNIAYALKPLIDLHGGKTAESITPGQLREVREKMIDQGLSRNTINDRVKKIRGMFKWAAREELIPASVWHGMQTLEPLKLGRSRAKETEKVRPVPKRDIDKVLPDVPAPVRAMIELQLLTGMRPTEVCIMRGCDLDMSKAEWEYRPEFHKTQHHAHERCIWLGPKAQVIIRPFLRRDLRAYLFKSEHHKASLPRYNTNSYGLAIRRACKRLKVPEWSPGQLRHNAATYLREQYGLEGAQAILGHSKVETTQVYAEASRERARTIMAEVG